MRQNLHCAILVLFCLSLWLTNSAHAQNLSPVKIDALTCEHLSNPIGIGNLQPRLSWKLRSDRAGEIQTAWEIRAASAVDGLNAASPNLWDSGKVTSDQSVLVPWAGAPLASRSQIFWQVRVTGKNQIFYDVTIPPNSAATLVLPVPSREIRKSGQPISLPDASVTRLSLVSGTYHFSLPYYD